MERIATQSSDVLLARISRELERVSEVQHRLARRRTLLQQQATRLRLGASPSEVRSTLRVAAAAEQEDRRGWEPEWLSIADDRARDEERDR